MQRVSEIRQKRERVFYKKRMGGNKERQKAANRKLAAENEHLLPKMRSSERLALEQERIDGEKEEEVPLTVETVKVFGKQKIRRRVRVDGGVEDDMELD